MSIAVGLPALIPGTHELIAELVEHLRAGEAFDNRKLSITADRVFGGSRAKGTFSPRDAYDAMETAVSQLLLGERVEELMRMNVTDALASLRSLTAQLPRQDDRTTEQTEWQQFSTPPALAFLAAKLLAARVPDIVLEPSAGTGSLAIWPRSIGARVVCNEINVRRRSLLIDEFGFETHGIDAELLDDLLPAEIQPTAILMNPPFSATGGRVAQHRSLYGARHLESALRRLQAGGRLVAITGEGMSLRRPAFAEWWQRIAETYNVRANFGLPGREYGKYGTTFGVQILVIDKTGATPGDGWQERLEAIRWGEAESLEEAWDALKGLAVRAVVEDQQDGEESNDVNYKS